MPLVAGASCVILLATTVVGHYASLGYRSLFLEFQRSSLQHQINTEIQARMWEGATQPLTDAVSLLAHSSDLRLLWIRLTRDASSVNRSEFQGALTKALSDETASLTTEVKDRIKGAVLLDKNFEVLATTGSITAPSGSLLALLRQSDREEYHNENRRVAWVGGEHIFAGLMRRTSARGNYWNVIVATEPLGVFDSIERRAGLALEIVTPDESKVIRPAKNALPDGAEAAVAGLTLLGPSEEPLALIRAKYDVASLNNGLSRVRDIAFAVFVVVSGGLSAIYLIAITLHLRRQKKADAETARREADRLAEIRRRGEEAEEARKKAEQERSQTIEVAGIVGSTIEEALQPVALSAETLRKDAATLDAAAAEAASGTDKATSSCKELSGLITNVAAGCEELEVTAREVSGQLQQASALAAEAAQSANGANEAITRLGEASRGIGDIARMISEIANKTNLLALNATIESARAGEAGKGFAVVASEVKLLASQTAKATQEISGQISGLQEQVNTAIAQVSSALEAIQGVDKRIADVSGAMSQQAAATAEIGTSIAQATQTTEEVVGVVIELNKSAQTTRNLAATTKNAVGSIDSSVIELKQRAQGELNRLSA